MLDHPLPPPLLLQPELSPEAREELRAAIEELYHGTAASKEVTIMPFEVEAVLVSPGMNRNGDVFLPPGSEPIKITNLKKMEWKHGPSR